MAEEITDEFANTDLKDERRNRRFEKIVTALAMSPAASISAASGGWGDTIAAYRLLGCDDVTPAPGSSFTFAVQGLGAGPGLPDRTFGSDGLTV